MSVEPILTAAIQSAATPTSNLQTAYYEADRYSAQLSVALASSASSLPAQVGAPLQQQPPETLVFNDEDDATRAMLTDDRKTFYERAEVARLKLWERFWISIYFIIVVSIAVTKILTRFYMTDIPLFLVLCAYPWVAYPAVHYVWVTLVPRIIDLFPRSAYATLADRTQP